MKIDKESPNYDSPIELLLIDDDPDILALMQDSLFSDKDITVTALKNSMEAIEELRRKNYDMVITDLRMPEVDGLTVACAIKEINPSTLVVIVTGYACLQSSLEAIRLGVYDYLPKPFSIDAFHFMIQKALKQIRSERENHLLREKLKTVEKKLAAVKAA